jgi:CMP-N-acetylneuraminic acid synthetase
MINKKNIIAIIPARGGSKGIPNKNIVLLCGKPLIVYTIEEAKKSKYINRIIVSTDNREIARIAKQCGVEVINRPANLAKDDTPILPVIKHALTAIKDNSELVVLLQPTSPLRTVKYIDYAIEALLETNCDSVVAVTKLDLSPTAIVQVDKYNQLKMIYSNLTDLRRQDSTLYRINGAIYVTKKDVLIKLENYVIGKDTRVIRMPKEVSIDIDEKEDLLIAEKYLKGE